VKGNPTAFVLVGCWAAAVHLGTAFILVDALGMAPSLANVIAFLCAFAVSFAGHRRHSFQSDNAPRHGWWRWLQVSVAGFLLNQCLYVFALQAFPHVWYLLLLGIVTATVAVFTYSLGKVWAFNG
jgi:putative flippase GtrA